MLEMVEFIIRMTRIELCTWFSKEHQTHPCKLQAVPTHNTSTHNQEYYNGQVAQHESKTTTAKTKTMKKTKKEVVNQVEGFGKLPNVPNPHLKLRLRLSSACLRRVYSSSAPSLRLHTCPRRRYFLL